MSALPIKSSAEGASVRVAQSTWQSLAAGVAALIVIVGLFPRAAAAISMGLLFACAGAAIARGSIAEIARRACKPLIWLALAFAGWGMASAAWSLDPIASLTKPLYLAATVLGLAIAAGVIRTFEPALTARLSEGVLIGLLVAGTILAVETVTDQALTRFFYNAFPVLQKGLAKQLTLDHGVVTALGVNNINRRATVVTLLLIPAVLAALQQPNPTLKRAGLIAIGLITATLLAFSTHQSSQAAIVAMALAFGLAWWGMRFATALVALAWCASCLLVVPMVTALHATDIHKDQNKLFFSARNRIVIWNYTAEQIKKAPFLGIGADATAKLSEDFNKETAKVPVTPEHKDGEFVPSTARHAHNVYLQVWFELGVVGAGLLAAVGLAALVAIRRATTELQPYLLAEFAAIAAMIAFSFSLWQVWLQGAASLALLAMSLTSQYLNNGQSKS